MSWIPLKFKIKNLLYECIVLTHKEDGTGLYHVEYNLNFQGKMLKILNSPNFTDVGRFVHEACERISSLTEDEALKIWEERELVGI